MRARPVACILIFCVSLVYGQEPIRRSFPWALEGRNDPILQIKNNSEQEIQVEIRILNDSGDIYRYPADLAVPAGESRYLRVREILEQLGERYPELKSWIAGTLQTQFLGQKQQVEMTIMNLSPKKRPPKSNQQQSPLIQSLDPKTGSPAGGTVVTIVGEHFTEGTVVKFGGIPALRTLQSAEVLIAISPQHSPGSVDIEVINGKKSSGIRNGFTYADAPVLRPRIWSVQPQTGITAGGYQVTIQGESFDRRSRVLFNHKYGETTYLSPYALSAVVPPGESGTVDISVATEQGEADRLQDAFLYNDPPVILSVTAIPNPIVRLTTTTITVEATDPEAGVLNYEYRIAQGAGTLTQQGRTAVYGSPNVTGITLIQVTVYDEHGAKSQKNLEITVE